MQRICVFAGSSPGASRDYTRAASGLAKELVIRGVHLVYGGARVGLMGTVADEVLRRGGQVIGVIPESLVSKEVAHEGLTELRVVKSMHERKAQMAELASGFVALPGGLGTLEETFEVLTWAQLGFHGKPCGLLNTGGFYDPLLAFLTRCVDERFVKDAHLAMLMVEAEPGVLLDRFDRYDAPVSGKWIDRESHA